MTELKTPFGTYRITQPFGANPQMYQQFGMKGHNGIDFVGLKRNYCIKEGDYVVSGFDSAGYGYYVTIRDSEGNTWTYAHFAEPVKARGHIALWQDLGPMGTTGYSTGVHCHITKKPASPNNNNGYKGAVDFMDYLETLNNPIPQPIEQTNYEYFMSGSVLFPKKFYEKDYHLVYFKKKNGDAKYYVMKISDKDPKEVLFDIRDTDLQATVANFRWGGLEYDIPTQYKITEEYANGLEKASSPWSFESRLIKYPGYLD